MKVTGKNLACLVFLLCINHLSGQAPANDNCENADEVIISGNGFGYGSFLSGKFDIKLATRQKGEKCAPELEKNGNCDKTVWFRFYIPTTRNIGVKLTQQDSAIPQIFAGFNIYKVNDCGNTLSDLALNLTPLNKFGQSGNTCLTSGWYYIQVGAKQKADGKLWIEISSSTPSLQPYDSHTAPLDFGLVQDKYTYLFLQTGCASVDEMEALAIKDSSMSKSSFCRFVLPANSVYNYVNFYQSNTKMKYRIFRDTITLDSIYGNKPFIDLQSNRQVSIISEFCANTAERKFFVQFVAGTEGNHHLEINIRNSTSHVDLWNTPATDDKITTFNGFSRSRKHYYNCDGLLYKHKCKPVIPDYYVYSEYYDEDTVTDTFEIAGYTIIKVNEDGILKVESISQYNNQVGMYYVLYRGDITKDCNLSLEHTQYDIAFYYCVTPGTYTLVTAYHKESTSAYFIHNILQTKPVQNVIHYYPKDPEPMGSYDPSTGLEKYSTVINFRMNKDTSISFDTFNVHGYFIYREFYLQKKSNINIRDINSEVRWYIFKGRISKGNILLLDDYLYNYWGSFPKQGCMILDTGYYTIISMLDTLHKTPFCIAPHSCIVLSPPFKCNRDVYAAPQHAYKINNNNPVTSASASKLNLDFVFTVPHCTDCDTGKHVPALLHFKKKYYLYPDSRFSYSTFYVSENIEFRVSVSDYQFELYKGNATVNPALLDDTSNIVSACIGGTVYCNLEGGKYYTLALFNLLNNTVVKTYFTPHRVSVNDFINHSMDLGHFNSTVTKNSTPAPITCHTSSFKSDPCPYDGSTTSRVCMRYYVPYAHIPYKDTLNMKRSYGRKNVWYTFTLDNASSMKITVKGVTALLKNPKFTVFRYKGPYNADFTATLSNNFDSTEKQFEFIETNRGYVDQTRNRDDYLSFTNMGCSPNRYFIMLEDEFGYDFAHYEYIFTLSYTQLSSTNLGDFCSDPATMAISSFGTKQIALNNVCHTYGNSPYETDSLQDVKSAWYKISISNIAKCDLRIRNTKGKGLKYYNVYGGSCDAMTRVAHLSDVFSYFTLSCMGSGNYFIQAVCDKKQVADIEFEVSVLQPENPNCKPYDFRLPIAQFTIDGGCNNDTVRFSNLSTTGQAVTYSWFINGVKFSSMQYPFLVLGDPLITASNQVKLVVNNTKDNLSDSVTLLFEPDTTTYYFKIQGPVSVICSDTVTLKVKTNYPHKINYTWTSPNDPGPYYTKDKVVTRLSNSIRYYAYGESDNCRFTDSFLLKYNDKIDNFRDTMLCDGAGFLTYRLKGYTRVFLDNKEVFDSFKITRTGNYMLYYLKNGCWIQEPMSVGIDTGKTTLRLRDTIEKCNEKNALLQNTAYKLKAYSWSTGESTESITVNTPGIYVLSGDINACRSLEYTVSVRLDQLSLDFLKDTLVCYNDRIELVNPFPGFTVVNKTPMADTFNIQQPVLRKLVLRKDLCTIRDSAMIRVFMPSNTWMDTLYCDSAGAGSIHLDAGPADTYRWLRTNETGRYSSVKGYGTFIVERTYKPSCRDSAFFMLGEDCPFNIFIPNAFTPNKDQLNEAFGPVISGSYKHYTMLLFNRWGEILYKTGDSRGWNGVYKGELVQEGVYAFLVVVYDSKNRAYQFRGTFTLLY